MCHLVALSGLTRPNNPTHPFGQTGGGGGGFGRMVAFKKIAQSENSLSGVGLGGGGGGSEHFFFFFGPRKFEKLHPPFERQGGGWGPSPKQGKNLR